MFSPELTPALLKECQAISFIDPLLELEAQKRLDNLTKPVGSLGRLEDLAKRLYAIQNGKKLASGPARIYAVAGDHGVVEEGVAASPQAVTRLMVENFLRGGAAINCLCKAAGADLRIVDAGVACDDFPGHDLLISAKISRGTANIATGPAMTPGECRAALELGLSLAASAHDEGFRVLGTGEMGIGNTTPSSALFCAYLGFSAADIAGPGAGIPPKGLNHKARVIEKALEANADSVRGKDPVRILSALGGFEIAVLAGLVIGAAARRMAVMIDGFISTAAFVAASAIVPSVRGYCFFSHCSAEGGHSAVLENIGEKPLLNLEMRLGEGTGAALAFSLLNAAAALFNDMATFEDAGIKI